MVSVFFFRGKWFPSYAMFSPRWRWWGSLCQLLQEEWMPICQEGELFVSPWNHKAIFMGCKKHADVSCGHSDIVVIWWNMNKGIWMEYEWNMKIWMEYEWNMKIWMEYWLIPSSVINHGQLGNPTKWRCSLPGLSRAMATSFVGHGNGEFTSLQKKNTWI